MNVEVSTILDLYDKKVIELTRANVLLEAEVLALRAENAKLKEGTPDGETD